MATQREREAAPGNVAHLACASDPRTRFYGAGMGPGEPGISRTASAQEIDALFD